MKYPATYLEAAHKQLDGNRTTILESEFCVCLYCNKTFKHTEIEEWIDEGKTALCPYCSVDAVVGDKSGLPIKDEEFLNKFFQMWFT